MEDLKSRKRESLKQIENLKIHEIANNQDNPARVLIAKLKERNLTIGSCESFSAGLFCSTLAEIAGASAVLMGGIIAYSREVKEHLVGVSKEVLDQEGMVSAACAKEMAEKSRSLLGCDLCISFTGNAGPGVLEEKPAGLSYCAIAWSEGTLVRKVFLQTERNEYRKRVVFDIIYDIINLLDKNVI